VASFNYAAKATLALRLLTKFGTSITLARTSGTTFDPITGATVAGSDASVVTTGMVKKYPERMIDGTRIQSGDRQLILSNEQTPTATDKPVIDGESWSIVSLDKLSPDNTTDVIYYAQVRR